MPKKTVMGVHAPPPKLSGPARGLIAAALAMLVVVSGLALDPMFRWVLGLG